MADEPSFEEEAREGNQSAFGEVLWFLRNNKKWWLTPILVALFLLGFLVFLGSTGAAPFIYALF